VLALSCDGKGVVMRPDALRPATGKAAAKATPKLATRPSKAEKRHRKRMAEVGNVYDATPAPRAVAVADILPATDTERAGATPGPVARNKWVIASVLADAASVIGQLFDEAHRRDPDHARTWVALVDGNNHQINRITRRSQGACHLVKDRMDITGARWGLDGAETILKRGHSKRAAPNRFGTGPPRAKQGLAQGGPVPNATSGCGPAYAPTGGLGPG